MELLLKTSVILLAGGFGTRMQSITPKQFLKLGEKPIVLHSFELFLDMPEIDEIVVVCPPAFRELFNLETAVMKAAPLEGNNDSKDYVSLSSPPVSRLKVSSEKKTIKFALPGKRRQDSAYNGLKASENELICIHDAARPFISKPLVLRVLEEGRIHGAAAVGMPVKFTIKEADSKNFVKNTPDRAKIWEIQTPQVLHREILMEGFQYALQHDITVTDDVSLAELIGKQVKLVEGSYENLKITVPSDLTIVNQLLQSFPQ